MTAGLGLATAALITLGACAIGPDYQRPELPVPAEHRGMLVPQEARSYADLEWTDVFDDPDLRSVVERALANNLDLELAVARSYLGPELRGVGSTAPSSFGDEDSSYSLGLSLNWEIDLFGRLLNGDDPAAELFSVGPFLDLPIFQSGRGTGNVEVAEAQLVQAELAYRRGVLLAYREVADALVVADKVRDFIAQNEARTAAARTVLRLRQMRYRAGVVSFLEVLDAERQLFSGEIELARARLNQLEAYVELYRALGGGWSEPAIRETLTPAR